jgi:hypothetical protein
MNTTVFTALIEAICTKRRGERGWWGGGNLENSVYLGRDHKNSLDVTGIVCTASAGTEVLQGYYRAGLFGSKFGLSFGQSVSIRTADSRYGKMV